ncbi:amidohydrolase [Aliiglaciecola sp. CAU 1673]|uniref:amidohydrolase n=1 Tax=Aliiglaciecola sp. CAU 1673 TaxID=3032595 RepID=UPI0023DC07D1|nr:amidohydrolase [Aliiglaciecola sp. CAU 1673]MDF2176934.1 amidohydrolase [Aliiglaciecola sp. CAU 1673]
MFCEQYSTIRALLAILPMILLGACQPQEKQEAADLVISQSRIWTADDNNRWAEALAIKGDKILAVGSDKEIAAYIGENTVHWQRPGALVLPGFIDSHVHFLTGGAGLSSVQLRDAKTKEEFIRRIAEHAKTLPPGEWILNGDWDHENWGGELPSRDWIDKVTPDNPVLINRLDGHMLLANSLALQKAGINGETEQVEGGEIVKDDQGQPTGVLKDNAMNLALAAVPAKGPDELERDLAAAMAYAASEGVTSVHDMGDWQSLDTYRRARQEQRLKTRIYAVMPLADWPRLAKEVEEQGRGDHWLRIGGLKGFMDGSLGSHTAAFYEPYTDQPDDSGFFINPPEQMRQWIEGADAAGLHIITHAIGDKAIGSLLDIYAGLPESERERRLRIEHAQHIHPDDIARFANQQVIASMQPYHAIDDGRWADRVIGEERAKTTYAFASLLASGATIAFGSDWFVAPISPIKGIYAAVTRRTLDGAHPDGWVPEQKISVEQALRAYTQSAAYASFDEGIKGSLTPGKLADLVILDKDLFEIPAADIADVKVLKTLVGGEVVYDLANP